MGGKRGDRTKASIWNNFGESMEINKSSLIIWVFVESPTINFSVRPVLLKSIFFKAHIRQIK